MKKKLKIIIAGGAGFVGSSLAIYLKKRINNIEIFAVDNLIRKGSSLNIIRLEKNDINFINGDLSNYSSFKNLPNADFFIDAAADPSTLAGINTSTIELVNNNFITTINSAEWCLMHECKMIFLSTSRIYPFDKLNDINLKENETRFNWDFKTDIKGISKEGINEEFSTYGLRSFYGTSKFTSEVFIKEYGFFKNFDYVINRFSVIGGPWQMGKLDQGILAFWVAGHIYDIPLKYVGYKGSGKQVRDIIHIKDVCKLILLQIKNWEKISLNTYNIGGGVNNSVSLFELTNFIQDETGIKINIGKDLEIRPADIPIYYTNNSKIKKDLDWRPTTSINEMIKDTANWIFDNKDLLSKIFF